MPIDAMKTQEFVKDPDRFTDKYFVRVRQLAIEGEPALPAAVTWAPLGGGPVQDGLPGQTGVAFAATQVQRGDCLEVTSISGRTRPTCVVGLQSGAEPGGLAPKLGGYDAIIAPNHAEGYRRVYFLPARVNQLTFIRLPAAGGPDLVMTDPLSGCTILVGTLGAHAVMAHANAWAIVGNDQQRYMRVLIHQLEQATRLTITGSLTKGRYELGRSLLEASARQSKIGLGRAPATVTATAHSRTTVLGIRKLGVWSFVYLNYATVDSTRTGVKAFVRDAESHKMRISKSVL